MKRIILTAILLGFAGSALAQQSVSVGYDSLGSWHPLDPGACTAIYGRGRELCLADLYRMQQEQKIQDQQVALQRAQEETQKLRNELLRREVAQASSPAVPTTAADFATLPGFASWHAENRWFGSDRARTEFAVLYAKDLRQEQPNLAGTLFLNALSAHVKEVFLPARR